MKLGTHIGKTFKCRTIYLSFLRCDFYDIVFVMKVKYFGRTTITLATDGLKNSHLYIWIENFYCHTTNFLNSKPVKNWAR